MFKKKYKIIFGLIFGIGFLFAYMNGVFTPLVEKIINETPEAKISAYLQAVSRGDKEAAFGIWEKPWSGAPDEYKLSVTERRDKITSDFLKTKINSDFKIINIEWWTTCCTPNITDNPKNAGRAKVKAELNINNEKIIYIFDIHDREGNYAGEAMGSPVRHWVIGDIYLPK